MHLSLDTRFAQALRERVQTEIDSFVDNLDGINLNSPSAIVSVAYEKARYDTYRDVLDLIEVIQKEMEG